MISAEVVQSLTSGRTVTKREERELEVPLEMPQSCLLTEEHDPIDLIVPSIACRTAFELAFGLTYFGFFAVES